MWPCSIIAGYALVKSTTWGKEIGSASRGRKVSEDLCRHFGVCKHRRYGTRVPITAVKDMLTNELPRQLIYEVWIMSCDHGGVDREP